MWTCPICKTTNENNKCRSCGFDLSKDYTTHRSLCQLSASGRKIFKPAQPGDNILMASSNTDYVFGRKMDRTKITTIYFRNKKENIGEDAWDVSEKQNGSIMAWTEEKRDGFMDLYLAANGNILANKDCSKLFSGYEKLKKIVGLQYFRTDQTENMSDMFFGCMQLKRLNLKKLDTGNVTNLSNMFYLCLHLQSLNLEKLHTDQVTDMSAMFAGCSELKELDLGSFDTSNVKNMDRMFFLCKSLEKLNISSFDTGNVETMRKMFNGCESLGELDVNHFDTSKIANLRSFSEYTELPDNVTLKSADNTLMASSNTDYIFGKEMDRKQIKTIYFRNRKKGIGENAWDVSEKQDGSIMAWMEEKDGLLDLYIAANGNIKANKDCRWLFAYYQNLEKFVGLQYFRTDQTENMRGMFQNCYRLQVLDLSPFATSQVTDMSYMFLCCNSLTRLDLGHFNTSQVTDMNSMFYCCESLASLDVSHFDTSQVTDMNSMFYCCKRLASLDVSRFATSQVTGMSYMFYSCLRLASLDVSHFDTSLVTAMTGMFVNCVGLKSLDLSRFATNQVTSVARMFFNCRNLKSLNVSYFDTSQVTDMVCMFWGCSSLKSLDLNHFDTGQVTNMSDMFSGCDSLEILDVSNFDTNNVKNMSVPLPEYLAVPQGVRLKIKEPELPGDNVLMASSDAGYVFGRKMNREQIATIYFQNKKKNIGEDAWDVSE